MRIRSQTGRSRVRFATVVTVLLVSASGLAGCSGSAETPTSTGSGPSSSSSEPVTLVVATGQAPWNPAYAVLVKAYEDATGNTVDLRAFPNPDIKTQEVNDVQGQQHVFDVYQINESDIAQFNSNGWLDPFTNIDPSYTPDPEIFSYSNIGRWDTSTETFSKDGLMTSAPLLGNVDIFMYRTDIYDQLGLQVPKTWDDVIANGKAIAQAGAAKYGGVFRTQGIPGAYGMSYEAQALLNGAGASWFKDLGVDFTPTADTPAAIQAATWLRQLAELGPAATTTIGQAEVIAAMQSGEAAQTYAVAAAASQLEDPSKSSVVGKIGYAPLPTTPSGEASSATALWVLGVPAGLPDNRARAALDYINWMTSKEAMTLFAQNGGIPTRSDAYDVSGLSPAQMQTLATVEETASKLPEVPTTPRYTFSGDMFNITETELGGIAAGTSTPQDGMKAIQQQLTDLVASLKLPVS